jgi:cell division septal protein FtsQ
MLRSKSSKEQNGSMWRQKQASSRRNNGGDKKPHKLGRFLVVVVAAGLFIQFVARPAIGRIADHPVFTVRDIVVTGAEYLNSEDITKKASKEIGKNIFDVDIAGISHDLSTTYAAEEFTVYKTLPSTITIRIHERRPVALLNLKTLVGVDRNGVPLPHVGADLVETLPIVTGIARVSDLADSTVRARLVTGLKLLDEMRDKAPSTYRRISELNVSSMNTLGVSLIDNGLEVIIGDSDWMRKLPVLDKVISEVTYQKEAVKAVDVRFGEKVFVQ